MLKPQHWDQIVPGSKSDSFEDTLCMCIWGILNLTSRVKTPPAGVARNFEECGVDSGRICSWCGSRESHKFSRLLPDANESCGNESTFSEFLTIVARIGGHSLEGTHDFSWEISAQ
ncbi:hypothetical protein AVEN_155103-1 [Araneus ventricosus]|uniref:Uncharacterized protein n=1 Tax=Araneus ventricosus TaxID=182803 RepID=A0A4Y2A7R2_ARAVE|nr:hypothetical protein AVEN_155103-1 [Araneus ventricosus]